MDGIAGGGRFYSDRIGIYVHSGHGLAGDVRPENYLKVSEVRKCSARYCRGVFPIFFRKISEK